MTGKTRGFSSFHWWVTWKHSLSASRFINSSTHARKICRSPGLLVRNDFPWKALAHLTKVRMTTYSKQIIQWIYLTHCCPHRHLSYCAHCTSTWRANWRAMLRTSLTMVRKSEFFQIGCSLFSRIREGMRAHRLTKAAPRTSNPFPTRKQAFLGGYRVK